MKLMGRPIRQIVRSSRVELTNHACQRYRERVDPDAMDLEIELRAQLALTFGIEHGARQTDPTLRLVYTSRLWVFRVQDRAGNRVFQLTTVWDQNEETAQIWESGREERIQQVRDLAALLRERPREGTADAD